VNQVAQVGVQSLLDEAREIWGANPRHTGREELSKILVRLIVSIGDLGRCARGATKDLEENSEAWTAEVKKELGNVIFSTIRFADELGFSPTACIDAAISAQREFANKNKDR
jgi:hypothetical protein